MNFVANLVACGAVHSGTSFHRGENLDVLGVADLFGGVAVDEDGHSSAFALGGGSLK